MKKLALILVLLAIIIAVVALIARGKKSGDSNQAQEKPQESLTIKGSDTEVQLVSNLAEAFLEANPEADVSVTGGGSGVGIASLINGEIDLANSSRKMSDQELQTAKAKGRDTQEFILAGDGVCIITHPSNPISKLSMEDISKIYKGEITNWKALGGPDAGIVLYGRQSTSGTYVFFRDFAVKADYSPKMRNMEGSQAIVDAVITDKNGIGYVGVGYAVGESGGG